MIHDFTESLARSHKASNLPIWEEMYRKAFYNFQAMIDHRPDGEHQRAGIDRSVILENSKQILIDEKVRGRNQITGKVYDDILLEFWSDTERKKPGWVCKPLRSDYIAYAIAPLGIGYLLPVPQLQSAWRIYSAKWLREGHIKLTRNPGWITSSIPVTVPVLFAAIGNQLRINFTPCEVGNE